MTRRLRYSSFPSEQEPDRPAFTYHASRITASRGSVAIGELVFPLDHLVASELSAEDPARQDLVMKVVTQVLGADVLVDGRLTDTYSDHPGVDLRLDLGHGHRVLAVLPTRQSVAGDVSATAHLAGPFSGVVIDGTARGAEVDVMAMKAHHVAARYRHGEGRLRLFDISSEVAQGHVTGEVAFAFEDRAWRADLRMSDPGSILSGRFLPIEILVYLAGRIQSFGASDGGADESIHLHLFGVDITLLRRPADDLPHRVVLRGKL